MNSPVRERRLRTSLILLLLTSTVVAFGSVGVAILLLHLPQIEKQNESLARLAVDALSTRVELLLSGLEQRLRLVGTALEHLPDDAITPMLHSAIGADNAFQAIFVARQDGTLVHTGVIGDAQGRQAELIGNDISALSLFRAARASGTPVWSGKHLSALSGEVTIAMAVPSAGGQILIGEVPLSYVLHTVQVAGTQHQLPVWVVDNRGELVADTGSPGNVGLLNMSGLEPVRAALEGREIPPSFSYQGHTYYPAVARSQALDWYLLVRMPTGWAHERIRVTTYLVVTAFAGATFMGLLLAPSWAKRMERPVREMIDRARRTAEGDAVGHWPKGNVTELNRLSRDLEIMADAIQQREQMFRAIFEASPVPLSVIDMGHDLAVREVNDAWLRNFGHQRESIIGETGRMAHLWPSSQERSRILHTMRGHPGRLPVQLTRADGSLRECRLSGREVHVGSDELLIVVTEDVTEQERIDRELRELNTQLEQRVMQRTAELERLNEQLSSTVTDLRRAQDELVRAEKLAALGKLVAGVAHELNTPLGNGLMAVSVIQDDIRDFRAAVDSGLPLPQLIKLVEKVDAASDITARNLARAVELVNSFKQVAVDQTSEQRRNFDLRELLDELLITLQPMMKHVPVTVTQDVDPGVVFDSYPGALGQIITNLISNAITHGFDGRDQGSIRIELQPLNKDRIRLSVSDDGVGIPEGLIGRVFDPFVTSRQGSGGTGLGLHIVHNAVVNLLGGEISVHSEKDKGTTFMMVLPLHAPNVGTSDNAYDLT